MRLSAPSKMLWTLAVVIGIAGIIGHFTPVKYLTEHQFILVMIGFVLLVIGTLFRGA